MRKKTKAHIFVVDDDSCILDTAAIYLNKANYKCTCFSDADDCLQQLRTEHCDLLITDVKMPGKDGIELLTEAKCIVPWLPVLVMTSYADVPLAVKIVKAGAVDFIEKPLEWESLLILVPTILKESEPGDLLRGKGLTKSEKIILRLILQSKSNREIAGVLSRSVRTVEVHRSHIMHKLDVDNVVSLVKRAASMGLEETE